MLFVGQVPPIGEIDLRRRIYALMIHSGDEFHPIVSGVVESLGQIREAGLIENIRLVSNTIFCWGIAYPSQTRAVLQGIRGADYLHAGEGIIIGLFTLPDIMYDPTFETNLFNLLCEENFIHQAMVNTYSTMAGSGQLTNLLQEFTSKAWIDRMEMHERRNNIGLYLAKMRHELVKHADIEYKDLDSGCSLPDEVLYSFVEELSKRFVANAPLGWKLRSIENWANGLDSHKD